MVIDQGANFFFVKAQQLSLGQFQSLKEINNHLLVLQVIVIKLSKKDEFLYKNELFIAFFMQSNSNLSILCLSSFKLWAINNFSFCSSLEKIPSILYF